MVNLDWVKFGMKDEGEGTQLHFSLLSCKWAQDNSSMKAWEGGGAGWKGHWREIREHL